MIFWNVMLCSVVARLSVTFIFKVEVRTPNFKKIICIWWIAI